MKNPANPFSLASVLMILKKAQPDIIHTHSSIDSWLVGSASKLLGLTVVRSRHISIPIKGVFPNNLLYSKIPRKIITSGEAISDIVKSVSGVKAKNVKSVSAGVDFKKFDFNLDGKRIMFYMMNKYFIKEPPKSYINTIIEGYKNCNIDTFEDILSESENVKAIVQCTCLWTFNNKFGCSWKVLNLKFY